MAKNRYQKKTRLIGVPELAKKFKELSFVFDETPFEDFLHSQGESLKEKIKSELRRETKRDTGNLERSIVAKKYGKKVAGSPKVFVGIDYSVAFYAYMVEYGHGGPHPAPAHSFWRKPVRGNASSIAGNIEKEALKFINKTAVK